MVRAPIAQLAEAADLKSAKCGFESHWGHQENGQWRRIASTTEPARGPGKPLIDQTTGRNHLPFSSVTQKTVSRRNSHEARICSGMNDAEMPMFRPKRRASCLQPHSPPHPCRHPRPFKPPAHSTNKRRTSKRSASGRPTANRRRRTPGPVRSGIRCNSRAGTPLQVAKSPRGTPPRAHAASLCQATRTGSGKATNPTRSVPALRRPSGRRRAPPQAHTRQAHGGT